MDANKNTTRRLVVSPGQIMALAAMEAETLIDIANRVCDSYGYERLDDLMEGVDQ